MGWTDRALEHFAVSAKCLKWVNFGLSRPTAATSAFRGKADANDAKADMPVGMSAFGGKADVFCQELSGPFLAKRRHRLHRLTVLPLPIAGKAPNLGNLSGVSRMQSCRGSSILLAGFMAVSDRSTSSITGTQKYDRTGPRTT